MDADTGAVSGLRHPNHDLAEVRRGLHVLESLLCFIEFEDAVDHRVELRRGDGCIHLLEHRAGADVDPVHSKLLVEDWRQGERLCGGTAAQNADLRDQSSDAGGTEGLAEGASAADLDYAVHAFPARNLGHPLRPVRALPIVAAGCKTEAGGSSQLVVAGGGSDDLCSEQRCELQGEERDASGALNQDSLAGESGARWIARVVQGVPRGDAGAGERRGFFVGEVFREADDAFVMEENVLGEHAVDIAAECGFGFFCGGRTIEPALHEDAADTVAHLNASDAFADGDDLARAIGARDTRQRHLWVVDALHDHEIAVVERDRMDPNQS